jgi:hypothetical protein
VRVDDAEQVPTQRGALGALFTEPGEQRADVGHGAASVQLPVDARLEQRFLGLEVVIELRSRRDTPAIRGPIGVPVVFGPP